MDQPCQDALRIMNFLDVENVIECFKNKKMDYDALLLLKDYPETIPSILSELSDQLKLRRGLEFLFREPQPKVIVSFDAGSTISSVSSISSISSNSSAVTDANILISDDDVDSLLSLGPGSPSVVVTDSDTLMLSPKSSIIFEENLSPSRPKRQRVEITTSGRGRNETGKQPTQPTPETVKESGEKPTTEQQKSLSTYILDVLNRTVHGQLVIACSNRKGLDTSSRCKLAELVVTAEYKDCNTQITGSRFSALAKLIVDTFPGESVETYYISSSSRGKGRSAAGKLYDFYTNTNRELRKNGLRDLHCGTSSDKIRNCGTNPNVLERPPPEDATVRKALEFLTTFVEPWTLVEHNWEISAKSRLSDLRDTKNSQFKLTRGYIEKYPVLKQPGVHVLLEKDFEVLFPEAKDRMETHWNSFTSKLKKEYTAANINNIEGDTALLFNFPRLFSVVPVKVPGKKPWRASRSDIQDGFLVHLKAIGDLDKRIEEFQKTALLRGNPLQPFPVIVGEDLDHITSSYLILDNKKIRVENPKRAVEITFKAYHALYCGYPVQSERLWMVLQKALFCINEAVESNVKTASDVLRLISVLKV